MTPWTPPLSAIARPLISVAQAVWPHLRRVSRERQAGQMPFGSGTDLLEHGLDQTLNRLRGGNVDDTWWHTLLNRIGHQAVAPYFLCMPALQEWLADEQVQSDMKALARVRIMGAETNDAETQTRLQHGYAAMTGEDERLADGPIEIVLAILAAGYLGSIGTQLEPLAGMTQAIAQENREAFRRVDEQFGIVHRRLEEFGPVHYVVEAHSERAERALRLLLKQRTLTPELVRQELPALAQRVTDGDLRHAERSTRAKVYYWSARLHALQSETLPVARHYLERK
jgi:hypothetical protein